MLLASFFQFSLLFNFVFLFFHTSFGDLDPRSPPTLANYIHCKLSCKSLDSTTRPPSILAQMYHPFPLCSAPNVSVPSGHFKLSHYSLSGGTASGLHPHKVWHHSWRFVRANSATIPGKAAATELNANQPAKYYLLLYLCFAVVIVFVRFFCFFVFIFCSSVACGFLTYLTVRRKSASFSYKFCISLRLSWILLCGWMVATRPHRCPSVYVCVCIWICGCLRTMAGIVGFCGYHCQTSARHNK